MKIFAPDYFGEFACIKGDCRHSCCIGWEIDIDPESLEYFYSVQGEMGRRLRENIARDGESAHFILGNGERCPFLNDRGLCDMIIALGEDCLCQICDDHPRFRNFLPQRTEIGLGLCCEAAGSLILAREKPVSMVEIGEDDEADVPDEEGEFIVGIRDRLVSVMQERDLPIENRARRMLDAAGVDFEIGSLDTWADFLSGLERLDDGWLKRLDSMRGEISAPGDEFDTAYEQLMAYLLLRHVPGAIEDGDIDGRVMFAYLMWSIIRAMHAASGGGMDELIEICRMYSSEIEYSDENIGAILDEI